MLQVDNGLVPHLQGRGCVQQISPHNTTHRDEIRYYNVFFHSHLLQYCTHVCSTCTYMYTIAVIFRIDPLACTLSTHSTVVYVVALHTHTHTHAPWPSQPSPLWTQRQCNVPADHLSLPTHSDGGWTGEGHSQLSSPAAGEKGQTRMRTEPHTAVQGRTPPLTGRCNSYVFVHAPNTLLSTISVVSLL